jgi:hypothetical protein
LTSKLPSIIFIHISQANQPMFCRRNFQFLVGGHSRHQTRNFTQVGITLVCFLWKESCWTSELWDVSLGNQWCDWSSSRGSIVGRSEKSLGEYASNEEELKISMDLDI